MYHDKRLLDLLAPVRNSFFITILMGLARATIIIWQAYLLSVIIDRIFLQQQQLPMVASSIQLFLFASAARFFVGWVQQSAGNKVSSSIKSSLRHKILAHLFQTGSQRLKKEQSGKLVNTLIGGVDTLDGYFSKYLPQIYLSALVPILILLFVFPQDVLSGVVLLLTAPLIPLFMVLIGSIARSKTEKQWTTLNRMSAYFLDVLQGLTTLKILGRSREQIQRIQQVSEDFRNKTMGVLRIAFLSALVLELVATLSTAVLAVEIGLRLLYGKMDFQSSLFILLLAPEFYLPLRILGTRYHAGLEGVAAAQSIFEILSIKAPEGKPVAIAKAPTLSRTLTVRFQNVSFSYQHRSDELHNISFEMKPGTTTAIIGATGSGKSTIAQLLLSFIEPSRGAILVNGVPLSEMDSDYWRQFIAWVPQKPYLFHNSILENIRLAKPDASTKQVVRAAKLARIHDFISSLPEAYRTPIGERGIRLSGGQAQRIALARAYLKDAPLLILDEPTANLDPETEREIQEAMVQLKTGRTVLLIAHRLPTVVGAAQILILSEGRIKVQGTHRTLMKKSDLYQQMVAAYGE